MNSVEWTNHFKRSRSDVVGAKEMRITPGRRRRWWTVDRVVTDPRSRGPADLPVWHLLENLPPLSNARCPIECFLKHSQTHNDRLLSTIKDIWRLLHCVVGADSVRPLASDIDPLLICRNQRRRAAFGQNGVFLRIYPDSLSVRAFTLSLFQVEGLVRPPATRTRCTDTSTK